jgi:glycosyltransferase involved in cell wall biosynthesis
LFGIIVGSGSLEADIRDAAKGAGDRIYFAGFRNQSELPAYYACADLIVLPSTAEETWGLVVNEAFACGVPAVVSDEVGCGPDLIDEGLTGVIHKTGDVDSLIAGIARMAGRLADDPEAVGAAVKKKSSEYSITRATSNFARPRHVSINVRA